MIKKFKAKIFLCCMFVTVNKKNFNKINVVRRNSFLVFFFFILFQYWFGCPTLLNKFLFLAFMLFSKFHIVFLYQFFGNVIFCYIILFFFSLQISRNNLNVVFLKHFFCFFLVFVHHPKNLCSDALFCFEKKLKYYDER